MILNQLNLNHLRIFEAVHRLGNMTRAARELHLTQSGVSQHIAALEETLGISLFDRVRKRVLPTPGATLLFERCTGGFREIEEALEAIRGEGTRLGGSVTIGTAPEFGYNCLLPLLARFGLQHPGVEFHVIYGFATEMNDLLLNGKVNLAFVDAFELDRRIKTERVYQEELWLCASREYLRTQGRPDETREFFESLDYVTLEYDAILANWFQHHLGIRHPKLRIRASVKDVQGVARLVLSGLGAGIIPGHLVEKLRREGEKLHRFKGNGTTLTNAISLAYLQVRSQAQLVRTLIASLRTGLALPEKLPH